MTTDTMNVSAGPRVTADTELCCGSGMCVLTAPGIFSQNDEDGVVEILVSSPGPERLKDVREAVVTCPTSAIRLLE
jgi:ferredoxin